MSLSTHSNFLIPLQHDAVDLLYFKLRLFHLIEFKVWLYPGSKTLGCKYKEIGKSEFAAKT